MQPETGTKEDRELIIEIDGIKGWKDEEPMTLSALQAALKVLIKKYGPDAKIEFDDWNGAQVIFQRPLTDKEIEHRRQMEERRAKEALAIDKAWDKLTQQDREALQLTRKPTPRR